MEREPSAVILLGHGSRKEEANRALEDVAQKVASELGTDQVKVAYLQLATPGLEEVVGSFAREGVRRVVLVPFFLFAGAHVLEDIPDAVNALRRRHPGLEIAVASVLGDHPKLVEAAAERAREALA